MIEKLTEFCKSHNLAFLIEYDGDKLLRLMFVSKNEDDYELLGGTRGGRNLRAHMPKKRYCQDIFVDYIFKSKDKETVIDLLIDSVKTAFHIN